MGTYLKDFRQGDTKTIVMDYGNGVDVTGWEFTITLKESFGSSKIACQATTIAGDNTLDDVNNGLVHLTIDSVISTAIKPGKYYYDVQVNKGGSPPDIRTILPPIDDYKDRITVVEGLTV